MRHRRQCRMTAKFVCLWGADGLQTAYADGMDHCLWITFARSTMKGRRRHATLLDARLQRCSDVSRRHSRGVEHPAAPPYPVPAEPRSLDRARTGAPALYALARGDRPA